MDFSTLLSSRKLPAPRKFRAGDILLYPESEQYPILFLESGTVEVSRYDADGARILQSFMHAPQCFGVIEHFAETPLLSGVKALTPGSFYALTPEDALFKDKDVLNLLLRYVSSLYVEDIERRALEKHMSGKERVLYTIYRMAQKPFPYAFPLTREDLSDLLAIPQRSLYRYLKELEEEGYFRRQSGKILVGDEDYLKMSDTFRLL